jgi:hypothetical protein
MRRIIPVIGMLGALQGCGSGLTDLNLSEWKLDLCSIVVGQFHLLVTDPPAAVTAAYSQPVLMSSGDTVQFRAEIRLVLASTKAQTGCDLKYGAPVPARIRWTAVDSTVATASEDGVVIARGAGWTQLVVEALDHARSERITLRVNHVMP